jgi:hypothetical protein
MELLCIFCERNVQHKKPHLHAEYQDKEIVVAFEGGILQN